MMSKSKRTYTWENLTDGGTILHILRTRDHGFDFEIRLSLEPNPTLLHHGTFGDEWQEGAVEVTRRFSRWTDRTYKYFYPNFMCDVKTRSFFGRWLGGRTPEEAAKEARATVEREMAYAAGDDQIIYQADMTVLKDGVVIVTDHYGNVEIDNTGGAEQMRLETEEDIDRLVTEQLHRARIATDSTYAKDYLPNARY